MVQATAYTIGYSYGFTTVHNERKVKLDIVLTYVVYAHAASVLPSLSRPRCANRVYKPGDSVCPSSPVEAEDHAPSPSASASFAFMGAFLTENKAPTMFCRWRDTIVPLDLSASSLALVSYET